MLYRGAVVRARRSPPCRLHIPRRTAPRPVRAPCVVCPSAALNFFKAHVPGEVGCGSGFSHSPHPYIPRRGLHGLPAGSTPWRARLVFPCSQTIIAVYFEGQDALQNPQPPAAKTQGPRPEQRVVLLKHEKIDCTNRLQRGVQAGYVHSRLRKKRSSCVAAFRSSSAIASHTGVERSAERRAGASARASDRPPISPMPKTPHAAMLWQMGKTSLAGRCGRRCEEHMRLYDACRSASVHCAFGALTLRPRSTSAQSRSCWCCGRDSSSAMTRDLKAKPKAEDMWSKRRAGFSSQTGCVPPAAALAEDEALLEGETSDHWRSSSAALSAAIPKTCSARRASPDAAATLRAQKTMAACSTTGFATSARPTLSVSIEQEMGLAALEAAASSPTISAARLPEAEVGDATTGAIGLPHTGDAGCVPLRASRPLASPELRWTAIAWATRCVKIETSSSGAYGGKVSVCGTARRARRRGRERCIMSSEFAMPSSTSLDEGAAAHSKSVWSAS
mmetsp:Transcript_17813/g.58198  ORF Transcript_17813/g.58198 Transcript_17813/m.58198 type:complete len:504 (+) Transcript_17813:108-1619(+)